MSDTMKTCIVFKASSGYWQISADDYKPLGGNFDTELEAYKYANRHGFLVR